MAATAMAYSLHYIMHRILFISKMLFKASNESHYHFKSFISLVFVFLGYLNMEQIERNFIAGNATRPLSRCYLRLYLVKNTAGAHKEPSKKYKSNHRTLKSKSYEQCRTKYEYYNFKVPHFLKVGLHIFPI